MKHIFSLLLAATMLFVVAGCNSSLRNSTPDELGESIFLALKNNDPEGFRSLFPGEGDIDEIVEKQGENKTPEEQEKLRTRAQEQLKSTDARAREGFEGLRADIMEAGLSLDNSKWEGVDVKKEEAEKNIEVVSLKLFFKDGDQTGTLIVRGAGKLNRGWLMDRAPRFEPYNGQ